MDGCICVRSAVAPGGTRRLHEAELALHQFQHLLVSDVAGSGDHQMVRREPLSKSRAQRVAMESLHGFRGAKNRAADRKSTRLNSSHLGISYAVFCLKKKNKKTCSR